MVNLKIAYDEVANAAYVYFADPATEPRSVHTYPCDPVEVSGTINLDFLADGRVLGIEVLGARSKLPSFLLDAAEGVEHPPRPARTESSRAARPVRATTESLNGSEIKLIEVDAVTAGERAVSFPAPTWHEDAFVLVVSLPRDHPFAGATVTVHPHRDAVPAAFLTWAMGVAERRLTGKGASCTPA
ncbi:DUF2283 domain-containing protein [Amycolatopsis sp. NPDC004368]